LTELKESLDNWFILLGKERYGEIKEKAHYFKSSTKQVKLDKLGRS
jgi:hypothetical protein